MLPRRAREQLPPGPDLDSQLNGTILFIAMSEIFWLIGILVAWFALQRFVLPRFGIGT